MHIKRLDLSLIMEQVSAGFLEYMFEVNGKHIQEISNYTRSNARERAYAAYKVLNRDEFIIPSVFHEGNESKVVPDFNFGYDIDNNLSYIIFTGHSHKDGLAISSKRDLRFLSIYRKILRHAYNIDVKIIEAVASPLSEGDHALFLIQEKTDNPITRTKVDKIHSEIVDAIERSDKEEEIHLGDHIYMHKPIAEIYESTGCYNALEIQFSENTGLHIPQKDLEKFSFEFDASNVKMD